MVSSNQFNKQSIILLYISVVKSDKQERSRIVQFFFKKFGHKNQSIYRHTNIQKEKSDHEVLYKSPMELKTSRDVSTSFCEIFGVENSPKLN